MRDGYPCVLTAGNKSRGRNKATSYIAGQKRAVQVNKTSRLPVHDVWATIERCVLAVAPRKLHAILIRYVEVDLRQYHSIQQRVQGSSGTADAQVESPRIS